MIWEYKTLFFKLTGNTGQGDSPLDEEGMEAQLNHLGQAGWDLVNVAPCQGGVLAFLKKNLPDQPAVQGEKLRSGVRPALRNRATPLVPAVDSLLNHSLQARAAEPENNRLGEIRIS